MFVDATPWRDNLKTSEQFLSQSDLTLKLKVKQGYRSASSN